MELWISIFLLCAQGKQKADRNRARVEENFLKQTHAQRQEAAQTRREEKKRAEKERIMNEEDPERQRRLEVWNRAFYSKTSQNIVHFLSERLGDWYQTCACCYVAGGNNQLA